VTYAVTPYGRNGPSSRVRVYEWLDRLDEPHAVSGYIGHHNADPAYLARHPCRIARAERRLRRFAAAEPETLLLHREASPLSRGGLERRLLSASRFAVYDFDDALQWDHGEGGIVRRLAPKSRKALIGAQTADRVVAGNPVLAEWASEHCRDVVMIPSCVAPERYRRKRHYAVGSPPRLGWLGSADNEVYLRLIERSLSELHDRTGARLTLIGTAKPVLGALEGMIDRVAWSEAAQCRLLAEVDVALAPVPDAPYERGKSGYKLLQYGSAAVPMVASPVGVNREIMAAFRMPAPEAPEEWLDAISEVLSLPAPKRAELGRRAREVTAQRYSFDTWLPRWRGAVAGAER
jgi:glycosyltransferase involved in cell wall biosynthesis